MDRVGARGSAELPGGLLSGDLVVAVHLEVRRGVPRLGVADLEQHVRGAVGRIVECPDTGAGGGREAGLDGSGCARVEGDAVRAGTGALAESA
jgi:hypothetical protein